MPEHPQVWTNQAILREFLKGVVQYVYAVNVDAVREAASEENPNRLRDRLIDIQIGVIADIFAYIDGATGPSDWPGIKLVNGETGESLSDELAWDLSSVEGEFLESFESWDR